MKIIWKFHNNNESFTNEINIKNQSINDYIKLLNTANNEITSLETTLESCQQSRTSTFIDLQNTIQKSRNEQHKVEDENALLHETNTNLINQLQEIQKENESYQQLINQTTIDLNNTTTTLERESKLVNEFKMINAKLKLSLEQKEIEISDLLDKLSIESQSVLNITKNEEKLKRSYEDLSLKHNNSLQQLDDLHFDFEKINLVLDESMNYIIQILENQTSLNVGVDSLLSPSKNKKKQQQKEGEINVNEKIQTFNYLFTNLLKEIEVMNYASNENDNNYKKMNEKYELLEIELNQSQDLLREMSLSQSQVNKELENSRSNFTQISNIIDQLSSYINIKNNFNNNYLTSPGPRINNSNNNNNNINVIVKYQNVINDCIKTIEMIKNENEEDNKKIESLKKSKEKLEGEKNKLKEQLYTSIKQLDDITKELARMSLKERK